jgi:hypothetical protein
MPRIVRTARGEQIDFDAIVIKQQIAAAPMNIDVARRKEFIDSKEGKVRGARRPSSFVDGAGNATANTFVTGEATRNVVINDAVSVKQTQPSTPTLAGDFEIDAGTTPIKSGPIEAVPIIPERKK